MSMAHKLRIGFACNEKWAPMRFDESQIKRLVLEHLRSERQIDSKSVIASEFVLAGSGNRIDLAIWNGEFIGIEIKSEFDTLRRLNSQISSYQKCFDRVIIVAAEKHITEVDVLFSSNVELWKLNSDGRLSVYSQSAGKTELGKTELIRMLSLPQLRKFVGLSARADVPRSMLRMIAEEMPIDFIRAAVVSSFREGFAETSAAFWETIRRRKLRAVDIDRLSRTRIKRSEQKHAQSANIEFWKNWVAEAEELFNNAA